MTKVLPKSILKERVTNINKPSVATGYNNGITQEQFVSEVFRNEQARPNFTLIETGITAGGATQALSYQLNNKAVQVISTVTVANDGVLLPKAVKYMTIKVVNKDAANDLTVYPVIGQYMDGVINDSVIIAPNENVTFIADTNSNWVSII